MFYTQVGKGTALVDTEQQLIGVDSLFLMLQAGHLILAAQQPAGRAGAAVFGVLVGGGVLHALVKGHGDGRTQVGLDLHALLRPHKNAVTVQVGVEGNALLGDLAQLGQAEHLEPTAVGQDGTVPLSEFVQTAHLGHQLVTGAQMQMVGVAQHDLGTDVFQIQRRQTAFDGGGGGNVLECGGLHGAVHRSKFAATGGTFLFDKAVRHRFYLHFKIDSS